MRDIRASAVALGVALVFGIALVAVSLQGAAGARETTEVKRYNVVLAGEAAAGGFGARNLGAARDAVSAAGGDVEIDLSDKIGALVVESSNPAFARTLRASGAVADVAEDVRIKSLPDRPEAVEVTQRRAQASEPDPLESQQWSMKQIRAPFAQGIQDGRRPVEVGVLDSGIDGDHLDFTSDGVAGSPTNVDCAKGDNFVPLGPGIGTEDPCEDNQFHGTHVAGIVAAQANGFGVVGVAPGVTLVPVKVCDAQGYCYASATAAGITYAGDLRLDVINMSFYVDDDGFMESTEFKCNSDPEMRVLRRMNERAIAYARSRGVVQIAALGNSDQNLNYPVDENGNPIDNEDCEVVPAETEGVIGTASLGPRSEKAGYSNYGYGPTDVAAPGGNGMTGNPQTTVLSTFPDNAHGAIQGTSMASPHAAGVAALIVSEFGRLTERGGERDVVMDRAKVESFLKNTTVDIGKQNYDKCAGNGRVDAVRAVNNNQSSLYEKTPFCPEYVR